MKEGPNSLCFAIISKLYFLLSITILQDMPKQTRQLAAIMFTDIVGYTRLMGEDESVALSMLQKNRDIHKSFIRQFHGKF